MHRNVHTYKGQASQSCKTKRVNCRAAEPTRCRDPATKTCIEMAQHPALLKSGSGPKKLEKSYSETIVFDELRFHLLSKLNIDQFSLI